MTTRKATGPSDEQQYRLSEDILPWFLSENAIEAYIEQDDYVVLDFETTNRTSGLAVDPSNHLVLACWTVCKDGEAIDRHTFGDEYSMAALVADVRAAKFIVAHNAKFELQWLERCGIDLREILVFDTMVMEWVIGGNKKMLFNLDSTAKRYKLGVKESLVSKLIKAGSCPSTIPRSWLLGYCKMDVKLCHEIFKKQCGLLSDMDLWHIALQRNLVIPVLADIELQGLHLDRALVYEEEARLQEVVARLGEELDTITGGINLGSPKQLGGFLYGRARKSGLDTDGGLLATAPSPLGFAAPLDNAGEAIKTGGGEISTAVTALAKLVATTEEQRHFLTLYKEYNLASSMLSKNMSFFKNVCDERGAVFYGQLQQCRTANHRLASTGVKIKFENAKKEVACQLQNLPRQYKKLFTSHDPDYEVTEYDGSQIEFRVAADLGHDKVAESDIVNGVDIHSFTRDTMNEAYKRFGIDKEIDRQGAKPNTFAPLYGAFGKDKAEQEYAQAFRAKYHDIYNTQQDWSLTVADRKKLVTPYGLTFYWPDAKMHRSGYVSYSTEIFNLPISGLATGEIIPMALVHFWHRCKGLRMRIFNTVHDSICVRNHKEEIEMVTAIAKQAMTHDCYNFLRNVYKYEFRVPLGFGMKSGTNWGVSDSEHKWDVWPDGNERYQIEVAKKTTVIYDTRKENNKNDSGSTRSH